MYDDDFPSQKKIFGGVVGWVVGLLALIVAITVAGWAFTYFTADVRGKVEAQRTLKSGNFRITAYNHFFDACASIQTAENNLLSSWIELETAPADDKARIRTNITGQQATRSTAINDYNADASKSWTVGQFRAEGLPYHIDNSLFTPKSEVTQCQ